MGSAGGATGDRLQIGWDLDDSSSRDSKTSRGTYPVNTEQRLASVSRVASSGRSRKMPTSSANNEQSSDCTFFTRSFFQFCAWKAAVPWVWSSAFCNCSMFGSVGGLHVHRAGRGIGMVIPVSSKADGFVIPTKQSLPEPIPFEKHPKWPGGYYQALLRCKNRAVVILQEQRTPARSAAGRVRPPESKLISLS